MIEVNNLTTNQIDKKFLIELAKNVLRGENKKIDVSVVLVGQARIRGLNKKYRGKNKATDVLSFQYDQSGEIVICLKEVKKNTKKSGLTVKKELANVLIHGILHILNYNHEKSVKVAEIMEKKQNYYLKNA